MQSILQAVESAQTELEPLDIVVPYTTPELTRLAILKARELTAEIPSRIRILRMQRVPFPLQLQNSPVSVEVLRRQTAQIADGLRAAEISIFLTREPEETLLQTLRPESVLVIASKRRPWRTAQQRLKRLCARHGHSVAMLYV